MMQARFKEAIPSLDKAVQLEPDNGSYRNNRGVAQHGARRVQGGRGGLRGRGAFAEPGRPALGDDQSGPAAAAAGDFVGAEQEFSNALARDPKSFAAIFGRASARENRGDLEGAAEDYLAA